MNCLLGFFLGFFTCAIGVVVALMFDIGMDRVSGWFKRIF